MNRADAKTSFWLALGLIVLMVPRETAAQLAPTGGHYAGRPSDTGYEPGAVNASGGYAASVPLDLPAARGGLPVPLQITSGARGVGAAGLGWDVPLSYVRRDTSFAGRRPLGGNLAPQGREQVSLTLQGRHLDLVRKGQDWVARQNAPELMAREENGTWVLFDGRGLTYTFTAPSPLAGAGLWLLASVSGAGGANLQIEYDITTPALTGGSGISIDLVHLLYDTHPQTGCAKHEVNLIYNDISVSSPLALSVLGDRVLARMHTLKWVDVMSRASCGLPAERLRRYELSYLPDADIQQPRLASVQMFGRQGSAEENTAVPVASYGYGSASSASTVSALRELRYEKTQAIPLPIDVDSTKISSTVADATVNIPNCPTCAPVGYATWQSLTDATGDGRPDLVFQKNGKLWVAPNRPGPGGSTVFDSQPVGQLSDITFASGPFETRSATDDRFHYSDFNVDQVWRMAIDVNGDGRIDIIDAAEQADQWVVYLNTPGPGPSEVKWERRSYSTQDLYQHMNRRGLNVDPHHIPLVSRFTGRDYTIGACLQYTGGGPAGWVDFPLGWSNGQCTVVPQGLKPSGGEKTFTEWEVKDVNGDGYPDVVFNSSPVGVYIKWPGPAPVLNSVANVALLHEVRLRDNGGGNPCDDFHNRCNNVDAVINTQGLFVDELPSGSPFSLPISIIRNNTWCGLALWEASEQGGSQRVVCDLADINGDGLLDRVENTTAFLGTGGGFSSVQLTLPGPLAVQGSPQVQACQHAGPNTAYSPFQTAGLRDLTGDGIPDYIDGAQVWIGTAAGFAPPIPIKVVGAGFSFSEEQESCDGKMSNTLGGLYDIDGDGKPEIVHLKGQTLEVYQLAGGTAPGTPEAGRLVQLDNGYGAKTTIGYRSAKEDGTTLHQVPFPEIVVTSVETAGTQGLGGALSATRYAYGGAELIFDPVLDAFTLPAYARSVELRMTSAAPDKPVGAATVTDTYGLIQFMPTMSKSERFSRYALAGRVRDITVLSGEITTDPWALLATPLITDSHRIASTHHDWGVRLFEEPAASQQSGVDCLIDMMYPYDYALSFGYNLGPDHAYNFCSAHGLVYGQDTESWRGDAAPPSANNVLTRSEVRNIDDFGRVTTVVHFGDLFRSDDDICVETKFAAPTGQNERVLSAPSSRRISTDCIKPNLPTYATEYFEYDHLPLGSVSAGFVTSHTVERRATDDGTLLKTVRAFDADYDVAGNLTAITSTREDGASRKMSLDYDPFGLVSVHAKIEATGVAAMDVSVTRDAVSLEPLSTRDVNQMEHGVVFDGFGRVVRSTVKPPGGSLGVLSTRSYLGFSGADPLGRRVVSESFSDPVAPGSIGVVPGHTSTLYLDELGRERRSELALGSDYANQLLIAGARTYDTLGRVAFEADPFPSTQDAATAYGTTFLFNTDGSPSCFIRGRGLQPLTQLSDAATELYPTCFLHFYANHQETSGVSDAASLTSGTQQTGLRKFATLSAIGRLISRSTWKGGIRLEHATFAEDHLGRLTSLTRYLDPVAATDPVQSLWRLDSFGQMLEMQEPESAPKFANYSDFGELLEVQWTDTTTSPAIDHRLVSKYDALGRRVHREEINNGVTDPDTVNDYLYDLGVSVAPEVTPTFVLGRLAEAKAPTGPVFFSYDAFGRTNARTFVDEQGDNYVEKTTFHADGTPSALEFFLPDTGYEQERVDYSYDSAARLRSMKFFAGSSSQDLYKASVIDPFGRVRNAKYGDNVDYAAGYADLGRRMMSNVAVTSALGSRRIFYLGYDPLGRELRRREIKDGATASETDVTYDALGRLSTGLRTVGAAQPFNWEFNYDALGNTVGLIDALGTGDATLSYRIADRDRLCRIGYGSGGLGGTTCNVVHDAVGNVVEQPTRTGHRRLDYFASGQVRTITEPHARASLRYDAFGDLQALDVDGVGAPDTRHDRHYGGLIERRDRMIGGSTTTSIFRDIPGPGGVLASRHGKSKEWIFQFGESRGNRFFTDKGGAFLQDVDYQPFGDSQSSGALPGADQYTSSQWNGGDALAAFGLSQLGARLYDPVIGRFLSRDPLLVPRTAATTNPYAFAMNDPVNNSDPSGLDCIGPECQGPGGSGLPGGGPSEINPPGLYFPSHPTPSGANPRAASRAPNPTAFHGWPETEAGSTLRLSMLMLGVDVDDGTWYDSIAKQNYSVSQVYERLRETSQYLHFVDDENQQIDSFSSFSAGFGDAAWFWCPGCAANARNSWGFTSGDADRWAYGVGSFTGIIGSLVAPRPTSVIAPPKADYTVHNIEASVQHINFTGGTENCANCAHATAATLAGYPASALPGVGTFATELAPAASWSLRLTEAGAARTLQGWGPGSSGIIFGTRGLDLPGHFFNVINKNGVILFVDGQNAIASTTMFPGFDAFFLLRTN